MYQPGMAGGQPDIQQALAAMRAQMQQPGGAPGGGLTMGAELAPAPQMDQLSGLAPRYQEMAQKMGSQFAMQRAQDFAAGKLPGQQGQAPVMKPSFPMGPNPAGGGLNPQAGGGRMNPGVPGAQPGGSSPPIFGGGTQMGGHVLDAMKGNGRDPAQGGVAAQPGGPMMSKPLPFDPVAQGMQQAGPGGMPLPGVGGAQPGMQIKPLQQGLANARGVLSGGIRQAVGKPGGGGGRFNNAQGVNPRAQQKY